MSGTNFLNDLLPFTSCVLEELDRGHQSRLNNDRVCLSISLYKLQNFSGMLSRIIQSIVNEGIQEQLQRLHEIVTAFMQENVLVEETEDICSDYVPRIPQNFTESSSAGGRPSILINRAQVSTMRKSGMKFSKIAEILGVSRRTLYKHTYSLDVDQTVSDNELLEMVQFLKTENRLCGERYVSGHIRGAGKKVSRTRVREAIRAVDPVGTTFARRPKTARRKFSVEGPNFLWSMDGNEKLQPFRLYVHGCIDTYSRKIVYLRCATNKKAHTVLEFFKSGIQNFGVPKTVRSDKGRENIKVAELMLRLRGENSRCFITGRSVHNVRIERLWGEVNKVTERYKNLLRDLQNEGVFDLDNVNHMCAIAYIFIPRIQRSLDVFEEQWNHHKLRTARNKTPNELYLTGRHPEVTVFSSLSSESEDSENSEDSDSVEYQDFNNFASSIIPDPLLDDGANNLRMLVNSLSQFSD